VIADDRDEVLGILLAKDLLRFFAERQSGNLRIEDYLRPPVFIPRASG
jgi:magnesium and cobalt transporter